MELFNSLLTDIGWWLWMISVQVAILIVIIWAVDRTIPRASTLFRYCLWCIVLLWLCVPVKLAMPIDIARYFEWIAPSYGIIETIGAGVAQNITPGRISFATLLLFLGILWVIGVLCALGIAGFSVMRMAQILKARIPVSRPDITGYIKTRAAGMNIRQNISICYLNNESIAVPAVFGIVHPHICLSQEMAERWSIDELEPIIMHELAHIKNHDLFVNGIQILVQIVFFFHPLVWIANKHIRSLREEVCDDIALAVINMKRKTYTLSILRVVESYGNKPSFGHVGIGLFMWNKRNTIKRRIERIMKTNYSFFKPLNGVSVTVLCIIAVLSITAVSTLFAGETTVEHKQIQPAEKGTISHLSKETAVETKQSVDVVVEKKQTVEHTQLAKEGAGAVISHQAAKAPSTDDAKKAQEAAHLKKGGGAPYISHEKVK